MHTRYATGNWCSRHICIGKWIDSSVYRVGIGPDSDTIRRFTNYIGANATWIIRSCRGPIGSEHKRKEITPSFTHLFLVVKAIGIGGAAGKSRGNAVAIFMANDTAVKISVRCDLRN